MWMALPLSYFAFTKAGLEPATNGIFNAFAKVDGMNRNKVV